jgi:ribonuclease P protein component
MGEAPVPTEQPQTGQAPRVPAPHVDSSRTGDPGGAAAQGSQSPVGLIRPVRARSTFLALNRSRLRARRGALTVVRAPGAGEGQTQVAYAVGRRVGGAVARNRVRRRLRAAMRERGAELAAGAYLVRAAPPAADLRYSQICQLLGEALEALTESPAAPEARRR